MKGKHHKKHHGKKHHEKMNTGGAIGLGAAPAAFKRGGKVKHASGGKVKMRMDKAARGKKMSPSSPLSGAAPAAGFKAQTAVDKEND